MSAARRDAPMLRSQADLPEDWQGLPRATPAHSRPRLHRHPGRPPRPAPHTQGATQAASPDAGTVPHARSVGQVDVRLQRLVCLMVALGLLAVIGAGGIWLSTGQYWQVRAVAVEGTRDAQVIAAVQALHLTGGNILRADISRDAQLVQRVPEVASATVTRRFPATLVVQVRLRTPALLWHTAHGDFVVASDGTVLGATTSVHMTVPQHLPVVADLRLLAFGGRVPAVGSALPSDTVTLAQQLLSQVPRSSLGTAQVQYAGARGFIATTANGLEVYFGDVQATRSALPTPCTAAAARCIAAGVTRQLGELRVVLATCSQRGVTPRLIDLRWGTHPYYTVG